MSKLYIMVNTGIVQFARYKGDNYPVALPFGIYERYFESYSNLTANTGVIINDFTTVPVGEIWVVQNISYLCSVASVGSQWVEIYDGSNTYFIDNDTSGVINTVHSTLNDLILVTGENIRMHWLGKAATSQLYATVMGYKMKVDGT